MAEDRKSPTEEIIIQCIENLQDKKKERHAEASAAWKAVELKKEVEQYKICCLVKSREVWDLYVNLDLVYTVRGYKKSALIKEEITALCAKEIEMEQKLKDAVKCIKDIKVKLNDVVDEACKLERCVKEEKRCKKGLYEEMKKDDEWEELLKDIEEHSVDCFNLACKAFDAGVDVIGIQTFVDMDSLKTLAADLDAKMNALRTDVLGNATKAEEEWKKALTELVTIRKELVVGKFDKCRAVNVREGVEDTLEFLCDEHACDNCDDDELERICRKVKDNFGDGSDEHTEDEKDHQKKPQRKPSRKDSEEEEWDIE